MKSESLTSKTLRDIILYIREEKLQAGDSLPTEQDLLEIFNCSRTTLREVLAYLKGLGIVTSRRGSGFKVATVSISQIINEAIPLAFSTGSSLKEVLQLRKSLEIGNIELAVMNATEEDIANLSEAVENYERITSVSGPIDYAESLEAEAKIHSCISAPANSNFLPVINTCIREYFYRIQKNGSAIEMTSEDHKVTNNQHKAILACFIVRNPQAALACLKQHFDVADTLHSNS